MAERLLHGRTVFFQNREALRSSALRGASPAGPRSVMGTLPPFPLQGQSFRCRDSRHEFHIHLNFVTSENTGPWTLQCRPKANPPASSPALP